MGSDLDLVVSVEDQTLRFRRGGEFVREYAISTARAGVGFQEGSYQTPTGNFIISDKIGGGAEMFTEFKGRQPVGIWQRGEEKKDEDRILSRILWLDGTDETNRNTRSRYIYIHGTNQEELIGQPVSHGCVRMRNEDVVELFELVEVGTRVVIEG